MKKIFSYAAMLLVSLCVFTSCEDDRDSNPTLTMPTTFVLNNPTVGEGVVDLEKSTGIDLTWSQPTEYTTGNAPVVATYTVRISSTGTFSKQYDEAADDNTGADFYAFEETVTACSESVPTADIAKALQKLNSYPEDKDFASEPLYFQIKSAVRDAALDEHNVILSNVVKVNVLPYYVELKDASVEMWYILGNCIGDAAWTNKADACGTSNFPMFMVDGYSYDKKTGQGEIEMINYFEAGQGFKVLPSSYSWDTGLCAGTDGAGTAMYRNNGDDNGNVEAAADGYYRFVINTAKKTAKFEEYDAGAPKVYDAMAVSGSFNDWSDTAMTPVFTTSNNHVWCYVISSDSDVELKFKIVGSWDTNWGSSTFPTGLGTNNGDNIPVPAGKWVIMFNDLNGAYSITAAE